MATPAGSRSKRVILDDSDTEGPSKRPRVNAEDDDRRASYCTPGPGINKLAGLNGLRGRGGDKPAELFRKDLISAMKLPDTDQLAQDEYFLISDPWRQEWERGVQVPVNPDQIPTAKVGVKTDNAKLHGMYGFKLPHKFLHASQDETYKRGNHELHETQKLADQVCRYDLDDLDVVWLTRLNDIREPLGDIAIEEWVMEKVMEELEAKCHDNMQTMIKTVEGLGIEYDENVVCDVCRSPESEDCNEMVFCDNCDICVHQACYGIQTIPEGSWLCRICALGIRPMCILCPRIGGAMKSTKSGSKWAHVSCSLWIPEVSIGCPEKMEPITKISQIPSSRWALVCSICRERTGACIQCSVKTCKTAFHVTCAFSQNLEMKTILERNDEEVQLKAFCSKHTKKMRSEVDGVSPTKDSPPGTPKKKESELTEEEKTELRSHRLQKLAEEFYTCVKPSEVAKSLSFAEDTVDWIYNYWVLKRKSNFNKPLLTPKTEEADLLSKQQEDSLVARMKMFVRLRQDLERVRNLCYMVSRREKTRRSLFQMKERIFHTQRRLLENSEPHSFGSREWASILQSNKDDTLYSQHEKILEMSKLEDAGQLEIVPNFDTVKLKKESVEKGKGKGKGKRDRDRERLPVRELFPLDDSREQEKKNVRGKKDTETESDRTEMVERSSAKPKRHSARFSEKHPGIFEQYSLVHSNADTSLPVGKEEEQAAEGEEAAKETCSEDVPLRHSTRHEESVVSPQNMQVQESERTKDSNRNSEKSIPDNTEKPIPVKTEKETERRRSDRHSDRGKSPAKVPEGKPSGKNGLSREHPAFLHHHIERLGDQSISQVNKTRDAGPGSEDGSRDSSPKSTNIVVEPIFQKRELRSRENRNVFSLFSRDEPLDSQVQEVKVTRKPHGRSERTRRKSDINGLLPNQLVVGERMKEKVQSRMYRAHRRHSFMNGIQHQKSMESYVTLLKNDSNGIHAPKKDCRLSLPSRLGSPHKNRILRGLGNEISPVRDQLRNETAKLHESLFPTSPKGSLSGYKIPKKTPPNSESDVTPVKKNSQTETSVTPETRSQRRRLESDVDSNGSEKVLEGVDEVISVRSSRSTTPDRASLRGVKRDLYFSSGKRVGRHTSRRLRADSSNHSEVSDDCSVNDADDSDSIASDCVSESSGFTQRVTRQRALENSETQSVESAASSGSRYSTRSRLVNDHWPKVQHS